MILIFFCAEIFDIKYSFKMILKIFYKISVIRIIIQNSSNHFEYIHSFKEKEWAQDYFRIRIHTSLQNLTSFLKFLIYEKQFDFEIFLKRKRIAIPKTVKKIIYKSIF
jgi:glutaredoxin-related protein